MSYTAEDFGSGASIWEAEYETPLPGNEAGSYIPTPPPWVFPNAPAVHPFDTPAESSAELDPGFGEGLNQQPLFGQDSVSAAVTAWQEQPMGLHGLEGDDMDNTYGSLGADAWYTMIAQTAADIAKGYATKKGYLPAPEPPTANIIPVSTQIGPPPPPARPAWLWPAVIGGGVLLLMMMRRRR